MVRDPGKAEDVLSRVDLQRSKVIYLTIVGTDRLGETHYIPHQSGQGVALCGISLVKDEYDHHVAPTCPYCRMILVSMEDSDV